MSNDSITITEEQRPPKGAHGLSAAWTNFRIVFANADLRRIQLAWFGSAIGDWAYGVAMLVWTFDVGGAPLVGLWLGGKYLLIAFTAPVGGALADRMARRTFMLVNDAVRCVLVLLVVGAIATAMPVWVIFALGMAIGAIGGTFRPAQAGLIPQLATSPRQLTAANASAEILESIALFLGPALAAMLLLRFPIELVLLLNVATFLWSMAMVRGVRPILPKQTNAAQPSSGPDGAAAGETGAEPAGETFLAGVLGGFRVLGRDADLRVFTGFVALLGLFSGGWTILLVSLADERLGAAAKIGYLDAVAGIATILGGAAVLAVAHRARVGRLLLLGTLGSIIPIAVIGFLPDVFTLFVLIALSAFSDPFFNVAFATIPQRLVAEARMSSVFGALESVMVATVAIAAFTIPWVIEVTSVNATLAILGGAVTVGCLVLAIWVPKLDHRLKEPEHLGLVASLPLFATLAPQVHESLAQSLATVEIPAGTVILTEGDPSDSFFVIGSGRVRVTQEGRVVREEAAGEFFGEIGLLRDVPRTATVTAVEDTVLHTLSREDFLAALAESETVRGLAEEVVTRRLNG